jgi:hypothetical protein
MSTRTLRRNYENGVVIVNHFASNEIGWNPAGKWEIAVVSGGGNINGAGEPQGILTWQAFDPPALMPGHTAWILREVQQ